MNVSRPIWLAMPLVIAAMQVAVQQDPAPATDPRLLHFEAKVRPLLVNRCEECHAETAEGNLRVDSLAALLKGGDAGPAIVVGNPDASVLLQAVRHTGDIKMPKKRTRLTAEEVDAMAQWIRDGAVWPAPTPGATNVVEQRIAENRAFWSFRPLELPAVPTIADDAWPRTDIDRFVLARLETEGLRPVALGIVAGLAASIAAGRVLAQLLFGVAATDLSTYAAVVALILAAAVVATWIPARRVLHVDPMKALRAD